jgi:hypothetical protein
MVIFFEIQHTFFLKYTSKAYFKKNSRFFEKQLFFLDTIFFLEWDQSRFSKNASKVFFEKNNSFSKNG